MLEELSASIYNKSLDIISRREHSKKELKDKLQKKFDASNVIDEVIEKLISNNLVNDERYAEMYTTIRKRKGFGPKRIEYELSARGINNSISSNAIYEAGDWNEAAQNAFNKKFKHGVADQFKDKAKQKTFLQNRGFSFQEIDSVFS